MSRRAHSLPPPAGGFTLVELVVVLAVLAVLLAAAVPLASAAIDAGRRSDAQRALLAAAAALHEHYFDRAAFPPTLTDPGFFGVYLQAGVGNDAVLDPFGAGAQLVYAVDAAANCARLHSRGADGVDAGFANEELRVLVAGAAPGLQRTRERMRVIVDAMVRLLAAGGSLTGVWDTDRAAMGLGGSYASDGFGQPFRLDAATKVLRSAGPDRTFATADDLTN